MKTRRATQPISKTLKMPLSHAAKALLGTVTHVQTTEPLIALTFDDGPHPEYTLRLLEILDKYQAKATFFCVGKFAARHPEVIRQVAGAGHVLGNHTWDHPSFPLLSHQQRCAQIQKCAEALRPYGSRLFRPPYGHQSLASRLTLFQNGYQVVTWTIAASDWQITNASQIFEQILPRVRPGRVIVFHDRIAITSQSPAQFNREHMLEAVSLLLHRLKGSFQFVTLPALFKSGQVIRQNWYCAGSASWATRLVPDPQLVEQ